MIEPKCDRCEEELEEFGAIVLSPPNKQSLCKKFHLCKNCFLLFENWVEKILYD
jgi:hypothetical protein